MAEKKTRAKTGRPSTGLTTEYHVGLRITEELRRAIAEKRAQTGVDTSFVIRRALEAYVAGEFDPAKVGQK